jgi:hypothetical protein
LSSASGAVRSAGTEGSALVMGIFIPA